MIDKTVAYTPFSVWVCLNGNEWAKRQAAKRGIAFEALDNGLPRGDCFGAMKKGRSA